MRQRLLIVGAGGFGREVLSWALQVPVDRRDWEVGGFLDDCGEALAGYELPATILATPETHRFEGDDRVVVAIPEPAKRRVMVELLAARGAQFITLIHPTATLGLNSTWGVGCVFGPNIHITTNVRIGDHVIIDYHAGIGHDAVIGSFATIQAHGGMMGGAILETGAILGVCATLVPHAQVGADAVVGPSSVVLRSVDAGTTVLGVPARKRLNKAEGVGGEVELA